jgi:NhaP-type Na+/H+ and K+/H+ antiporter
VIQAVFFLVSPEEHPGRHLRILARIAKRVEDESFIPEWLQAQTDQELKEALFHEELMFAIRLEPGRSGENLIGSPIRGLPLPEGTLVAMIRRSGELIIPRGDTELLDGDRLTLIGGVEGIDQLRELYGVSSTN